jgi:RHS repeat-associated protein
MLVSRTYEQTKQLGNILATISDKKIGHDSSGVVDYYTAEVLNQNDYYPFGMEMANRKYSVQVPYRYGFNGKENDNEIKGEGNQIDYGSRVYDPRIGKFLSIDPLSNTYPMLTPYQYAGNSPIAGVDLDGKEFEWYLVEKAEQWIFGSSHLKKVKDGFTQRAAESLKAIINPSKPSGNQNDLIPSFLSNLKSSIADPTAGGLKDGQKMVNAANAAKVIGKGVVQDYASLIKNAAKGDEKAIGALGFEIILFATPGGEEGKSASLIPKGFKNAEQFSKAGEELAVALDKSGIKYEEIGVTGSSVTGVSSKGGGFREVALNGRPASDIDAFIVLKEDIPVSGGAGLNNSDFIHPDKMIKNYPALKAWSEKWTKILGREITPAAIKPPKKTP